MRIKTFFFSIAVIMAVCCSRQEFPASKITAFEEDGLWGYKNEEGQIVLKPQFEYAQDFTGDIGAVAIRQGWHYIDRKGRLLEIQPFVIDNGPDYFQEGLARFVLSDKIGFIDEQGRIVIEPQFEFVKSFSDSLAAFCQGGIKSNMDEYISITGGKWGFINRQGEVVIPPRFDKATPFQDERAQVEEYGQKFTIDKLGTVVK